jgi:hypothetical protein
MNQDPIVEEIRQIREQHSVKFNNDLRAIYRDLKKQEKKSGRKYLRFEPKRMPIKKAG